MPTLPPRPPLPRPLQAALFWRRNLQFLEWCRSRCGDRFTVWAPPWGDIVFMIDPDDIKTVFAADPKQIHAGDAYAKVLGTLMGPRSLFLLDEDEHLRTRKMMLPPFHGEAVRQYGDLIGEIAAAEVDTWPVGRRIRLADAMARIALEIILRAVFGVTDQRRLEALREQLPQVVDPGTLLQLGWAMPQLQRFGPWRRYDQRKQATDRLVLEEIAARRKDPEREERADVLSLLIGARDDDGGALSDRDLLDEMMTLLVAGHETTATGTAWGFERLLRTPAALGRLSAEVAGGAHSGEYLDAVVKETLRIRPVITGAARKVTADLDVGGQRLPGGIFLVLYIALVQRDPAHYADPLAFRPERFLEGSPPAFTWIPYGGGRRRCLGAAFASLEMKVILATVLSRVELAPARPEAESLRVKHITTVPARGAEAIVKRRLVPVGAPVGEAEPAPEPAPA